MTEPKWRHIDEVTEEMYAEGSWHWVDNSGYSTGCKPSNTSRMFAMESFWLSLADQRVYGPIPEPPTLPPKLRRFEAVHFDYGPISGVEVDGGVFRYWRSDISGCYSDSCLPTNKLITDIRWLDD